MGINSFQESKVYTTPISQLNPSSGIQMLQGQVVELLVVSGVMEGVATIERGKEHTMRSRVVMLHYMLKQLGIDITSSQYLVGFAERRK